MPSLTRLGIKYPILHSSMRITRRRKSESDGNGARGDFAVSPPDKAVAAFDFASSPVLRRTQLRLSSLLFFHLLRDFRGRTCRSPLPPPRVAMPEIEPCNRYRFQSADEDKFPLISEKVTFKWWKIDKARMSVVILSGYRDIYVTFFNKHARSINISPPCESCIINTAHFKWKMQPG